MFIPYFSWAILGDTVKKIMSNVGGLKRRYKGKSGGHAREVSKSSHLLNIMNSIKLHPIMNK